MNENPQSLSAVALAVSSILTTQMSASELNTLGLFLTTIGDILQLNSWQILEQEAEQVVEN